MNFCLHGSPRIIETARRLAGSVFDEATFESSTEILPSVHNTTFNTLIVEHPYCPLSTINDWRRDTEDARVILIVSPDDIAAAKHACVCGYTDLLFDDAHLELMLEAALQRTAQSASLSESLAKSETQRERLQTSKELRKEFLSKATHDLRTPLVSMQIYAQFLISGRLGPISELQQEKIESILHNGERLIHCIENINRFERLDSSRIELVRSTFDLRDVLNEVISCATRACMSKGISLGHGWPADPVMVNADRDLMLEALRNLFDNAVKATQEKGSITLAITARDGGQAMVSITDTGAGMDAQKLAQLAGGSLDDALRVSPGLGLQSARRILELHGSKLEIDSQPGRGTRVRFTLPVSHDQMVTERQWTKDGFSDQDRKRLVLIVDDDEDNLACTRSVLEYGGFAVCCAGSYQEARAQLEDEPVEAVLLDIAMAGVNGLETLRSLKHYPATSSIPVIMLSANSDCSTRAEAVRIGAAGFVVKPFLPARLLKELRQAISQPLIA